MEMQQTSDRSGAARKRKPAPGIQWTAEERRQQAVNRRAFRRWLKTATPAQRREHRASQRFFRLWLKQVDRWMQQPRYTGVTFPGIKDGDRAAEELVQFARDFVKERI